MNTKMMASFDIQPMESSGKISMTTTKTLPAKQEMLGSHYVQTESYHSEPRNLHSFNIM